MKEYIRRVKQTVEDSWMEGAEVEEDEGEEDEDEADDEEEAGDGMRGVEDT